MYKIFNYLFGWDYVYWTNTADRGIARVFITGDGSVCYYRYSVSGLIDVIQEPKQVVWLTCNSTKYFSA